MELVILFVAAFIGVGVGWYLREFHAMRKVRELLQQAGELEEEEKPTESRTRMRLERHGEMIYAYEEDGAFIAQGKDLLDLDGAIRKRFPDKKFSVQEQNLIEIGAKYHESV